MPSDQRQLASQTLAPTLLLISVAVAIVVQLGAPLPLAGAVALAAWGTALVGNPGRGSDFGRVQHHSEETAREIDQEVKRILDENLEKVRNILGERRQALEAVTAELMKHETIDSDQLKRIMEDTSPGARIVPGTAAEPKRPSIMRSTGEDVVPKEKDASAGT